MYPDIIIQHFRQAFGAAPEIVVRAPGRINVIGEHTDYNEGLVLPAAIDKALYFAVSPRIDTTLNFIAHDLDDQHKADLLQLEPSGKRWPDYLLGVFSELQAAGFHPGGVNVVFGGDIPAGAGLSSSAALETGILFALNQLFSLGLFRQDIIKMAQLAENNFVGMQCGIMDMFASVMGRDERVIRLDCRTLEFDYYPVDNDRYSFVLFNSGVKHALVASEYNTRRSECEEGVAVLQEEYSGVYSLRDVTSGQVRAERELLHDPVFQRCLYVTEEIERVEAACLALETADYRQLGALMNASHEGLRTQYEVSCEELDFLVGQARKHPQVLGARMMGGGFGGCTINLVEKSGEAAFIHAVGAAFEAEYGRAPEHYVVQIAEGVGELEM